MESSQGVPTWLAGLAVLFGLLGNVLQWLAGLRKSRTDANKADVDVDKIRQDLMIELVEKSRTLQQEWEKKNEKYVTRLVEERDRIIAVNRGLKEDLAKLEQRLEFLETENKAAKAEMRRLREENEQLRKQLTNVTDEMTEWKHHIQKEV